MRRRSGTGHGISSIFHSPGKMDAGVGGMVATPPSAAGGANANCEWHCQTCEQCGRHEARLIATTPIRRGCEITVPRSLTPLCGATFFPFEIFFDGGTNARGDLPASGAAALLWRIHSFGPPTCIARAVMAIPGQGSPPLAESQACGLALRLLASLASEHRATNSGPLRARIIGDCIPVVRYGAAQARFAFCRSGHRSTRTLMTCCVRGGFLIGRRSAVSATLARTFARYAARWANELRHEGSDHACSDGAWMLTFSLIILFLPGRNVCLVHLCVAH